MLPRSLSKSRWLRTNLKKSWRMQPSLLLNKNTKQRRKDYSNFTARIQPSHMEFSKMALFCSYTWLCQWASTKIGVSQRNMRIFDPRSNPTLLTKNLAQHTGWMRFNRHIPNQSKDYSITNLQLLAHIFWLVTLSELTTAFTTQRKTKMKGLNRSSRFLNRQIRISIALLRNRRHQNWA